MKDVFGTASNQIILAAVDGEVVAKKDSKKTNLVKIYLSAVPNLENTKDALVEIADTVDDEATKAKVEEFINAILKITEDILDLTKVAVKGVRAEVSKDNAVPQARPAITPGMISGQEPIQKG